MFHLFCTEHKTLNFYDRILFQIETLFGSGIVSPQSQISIYAIYDKSLVIFDSGLSISILL